MQVRMLGSGASDGWPNPWCECASCTACRVQGVSRANTSALVDGVLLLDAGHDAPRGAQRLGLSLRGVRTALVTHAHRDHHDPQVWRWRSVADDSVPLTVLAPADVLEAAADQLADAVPVEAVPGAVHELGGHEVRVLSAQHVQGAVLYDVTGPDGGRLLWATDTGVLPDETVAAAADRAYDLVLLELAGLRMPSHLTVDDWDQQVERLREVGAVTSRTRVVAVHLGHRNPPPDELDRWLADRGAEAAHDGDLYDTARRGRRVLVIGGQSSGKSAFAESLVGTQATYVATAPPRPGDDDWDRRVTAHVARRPASWTTLESSDLVAALALPGQLLVDDLGLWLTAALDSHWDDPRPAFDAALEALLVAWDAAGDVVLVAPEVGSGVVPATSSGRAFADLLGRATTALAARADEVVQVVAGIPRRLR